MEMGTVYSIHRRLSIFFRFLSDSYEKIRIFLKKRKKGVEFFRQILYN